MIATGPNPAEPATARRHPGSPRAVFFDLDGTLLATGSHLRRETASALVNLSRTGTTIILATGGFTARTQAVANALCDAGVSAVWTITHNGAAIWNPTGQLVRRSPMPHAAVHAAVTVSGPTLWTIFEAVDDDGNNKVYSAGRIRPELEPFIWGPPAGTTTDSRNVPLRPLPIGWETRRTRAIANLPESEAPATLSCWVIGTSRALRPLDANVHDTNFFGAQCEHWTSRVGAMIGRPRSLIEGRDINPMGITKAVAAAHVCAELGIAPADTAGFGDGRNDHDLIAFVGAGYAMANAHPRVHAVATRTAPHHNDDGVAQVIRGWLAGDGW
ncbi:MAG: HAD family phosphatase [Proteobacteria bacterium]|nr:HAD family phosphatase [Pseudomonadota bacterium]NDE06609.1 HAD family phosphatase [Chloroflexota bacterium]NDE75644.1 HAD family phosphatase [Pseudomonadota bacterium]NDF54541.1 HAD family phosphatase [Pseudomonadota bacterium]